MNRSGTTGNIVPGVGDALCLQTFEDVEGLLVVIAELEVRLEVTEFTGASAT